MLLRVLRVILTVRIPRYKNFTGEKLTEPTEHVAEVTPVTEPVSAVQAEMEATVEDMLKHGYVEVTEINDLKVGARVKHSGQRWPGAYSNGTATIERIFHKPVSSWSQKYHRQDIEIIVKKDNPEFGSEYGYWADYHTVLAEVHE